MGPHFGPQISPKTHFYAYLLHPFLFCSMFSRLGRFPGTQNLKNSRFPYGKHYFSENRRFRDRTHFEPILGPFLTQFGARMPKKMVLNALRKNNLKLVHFVVTFWLLLGVPGGPKSPKIVENSSKKRSLGPPGASLALWPSFWGPPGVIF